MQTHSLLEIDPSAEENNGKAAATNVVPLVRLDPKHPLMLQNNVVEIPDPTHKLGKLFAERESEYVDEENDEDDAEILGSSTNELGLHRTVEDDWTHDEGWVKSTVENLMPPPMEASSMATSALQKELKAMLREQNSARSLKELGWYMPPDFIGDNLFQWIVELHSFDESLPIAKDLKDRYVPNRCKKTVFNNIDT